MVVLSPEMLNQIYARHLDWYPAICNKREQPEFVSGLADIIDQFDLVLLDSYGVLCRGSVPVEGALGAIEFLRKRDKAFCVVSNDTMTNSKTASEKYKQRGFDFSSEEVLTSLDITDSYLATVSDRGRVGVIAPLEHPSNDRLEGMVRLNGSNGFIPDGVDTLLFLTGAGWTAKMQENLIASAKGKQFRLVLGNPDIGAPNGDRIAATPGYFLADLVERTGQTSRPMLYGKPDGSIFSRALERFNITDPAQVLMVGDTLYTDILGGNAMGFKTLLLQCGIYQGQNILEKVNEAGIVPDYIAPQL